MGSRLDRKNESLQSSINPIITKYPPITPKRRNTTTVKRARIARGHAHEGENLLVERLARYAGVDKPKKAEGDPISVVEYEPGAHVLIAKNNFETLDEDKKHTPE